MMAPFAKKWKLKIEKNEKVIVINARCGGCRCFLQL